MKTKLQKLFLAALTLAASSQKLGINLIRVAILVIFVWIGGLKFWNYEAEGIVPFVANSPFMSFFYAWFWPTNVCAFMKIFKNNAPLASSHIIVMQGLLTLPISTILGTINRKFGQQWAYHLLLVFSVLSLIAITLMLLAYKRIEKKETESLVEH